MKKRIALLMASIMFLSLVACGGSKSKSKDEEEEEVDPVEEAKEKLEEAYDTCCEGSSYEYASLGYDNMSLTIDTNPTNKSSDDNESDAMAAIVAINSYLGIPSSVLDKMSSTRALDGMQTQDCGTYTVTWNYHPDNGMKVIYEVNP